MQSRLFLCNSPLRFNPSFTFLELPLTAFFFLSMYRGLRPNSFHVTRSYPVSLRPHETALRNSFLFIIKLCRQFSAMLHVDDFHFLALPSWNAFNEHLVACTNQQPPQRGGAVPGPVWVGSKWLLAFPGVPVTPGTPHSFFRYAAP